MTMAIQLREQAARIADSRAIEIIATAYSELGRCYYEKIRHGCSPRSDRERDYFRALQHYVYHKIRVRRLKLRYEGLITHTEEMTYHVKERDKWRSLMDQIEFGLRYIMP